MAHSTNIPVLVKPADMLGRLNVISHSHSDGKNTIPMNMGLEGHDTPPLIPMGSVETIVMNKMKNEGLSYTQFRILYD